MPPIQRWSYVAATHINWAFVTSESFVFSFLVLQRKGFDPPPWLAVLMCLGLAGAAAPRRRKLPASVCPCCSPRDPSDAPRSAFCMLIMAVPMLLAPLEPPFTLYGLTVAFIIVSIAAGQARARARPRAAA